MRVLLVQSAEKFFQRFLEIIVFIWIIDAVASFDIEYCKPFQRRTADMLKIFVAGNIYDLNGRTHPLHEAQLVHFVIKVVAIAQAADKRNVTQCGFLFDQIHH